ncbi:MAG: hypothetical protein PHN56_00510 [Candidatus Nanoarchaeia archaeon]|nr:hypothetical protein [Candidatus Nanoarchaeia archaeon]
MEIFSDNKKILNSGVFITYNNKPSKLILKELDNLIINIIFKKDSSIKDLKFISEIISKNEMNFIFYNFYDNIDMTLTNPVKLGENKNSIIFMNFFISNIKDFEFHKIIYTFYKEDKK